MFRPIHNACTQQTVYKRARLATSISVYERKYIPVNASAQFFFQIPNQEELVICVCVQLSFIYSDCFIHLRDCFVLWSSAVSSRCTPTLLTMRPSVPVFLKYSFLSFFSPLDVAKIQFINSPPNKCLFVKNNKNVITHTDIINLLSFRFQCCLLSHIDKRRAPLREFHYQ